MPYVNAYAYAYAYAYGALGNQFYSLTTEQIPCFLHQLELRLLLGLPKNLRGWYLRYLTYWLEQVLLAKHENSSPNRWKVGVPR